MPIVSANWPWLSATKIQMHHSSAERRTSILRLHQSLEQTLARVRSRSIVVDFKLGLQSGELQFAGYHRYNRALCLFHLGTNLKELVPELEDLIRFGRKTHNQHATDPVVAVMRATLGFSWGHARNPVPSNSNKLTIRNFWKIWTLGLLCRRYPTTTSLKAKYCTSMVE